MLRTLPPADKRIFATGQTGELLFQQNRSKAASRERQLTTQGPSRCLSRLERFTSDRQNGKIYHGINYKILIGMDDKKQPAGKEKEIKVGLECKELFSLLTKGQSKLSIEN